MINVSNYPDLVVLGSTGSVGTQALDVARAHGIRVRGITAHRHVEAVEAQVREFRPDFAVMTDEAAVETLRVRLADTKTQVLGGFEGITDMLNRLTTENPLGITVENSILGSAGLRPTLDTLRAGHRLALANKESLVVGGDLVMSLARERGQTILPVDSEHSAIFQCLRAGNHGEIKKILLTASGGPFFGFTKDGLAGVTRAMTLAHPTWKMGAKITVDSATLMNKGFELIEAVHLFGVRPEAVEVVVHRESIIHSMVEYIDHSIIAQLSLPDMRHCVQYALTHPRRRPAGETPAEADLFSIAALTFARPDEEVFPLLPLARTCIARGGAVPCVLNAANEEIVAAFLAEKIGFPDIPELVSRTVEDLSSLPDILHADTYESLMDADALARRTAQHHLSLRVTSVSHRR